MDGPVSSSSVTDNAAASRYELAVPGGLALAVYRRHGDVLDFIHTEVPAAAEGQGYGSRLIAGALADVRRRGFKLRARCAFVAAFVQRHPEERDLLADDGA
jgi:uncharacterized protein